MRPKLCDLNAPWQNLPTHGIFCTIRPKRFASCNHSASAAINNLIPFWFIPKITSLQELLVQALVCRVLDRAQFSKAPASAPRTNLAWRRLLRHCQHLRQLERQSRNPTPYISSLNHSALRLRTTLAGGRILLSHPRRGPIIREEKPTTL